MLFSVSRVKGLPTKKKHRFRILAENLAGAGKPSVETDPILIKDPIGLSQHIPPSPVLTFLSVGVHTNDQVTETGFSNECDNEMSDFHFDIVLLRCSMGSRQASCEGYW